MADETTETTDVMTTTDATDLAPLLYGDLPKIRNIAGDELPGFAVAITNPPKTCVLRYPTPDELLVYLRAQKSIYHFMSRGKGRSEEVPVPAADLRLFTALRLDRTGEEFDPAEIRYALGLITQHRVSDTVKEGLTYRITLDTLLSRTEHVVESPFVRDREEYELSCVRYIDGPNNTQERRYPPEPPVKLYDKVVRSVQGYVGCQPGATNLPIALKFVPPHHKVSVVVSLISAIRQLDPVIGGGSDPNQ